MDEIKETIKVYIRQRPPNPGDPMENSTMIGKSIVRKDGGTVAISGIQSVAANGQSCTYFSGISHANHKFAMDRIFTGDATQNDVYDVVARPIVDSCLKGYAGLVLAYGPTGSGKTYTMRGPQGGELRGIMPRCIEQILSATSNGTTEVWASYLQIYCEQISDLLRDNAQDNIPAIDLTNPATATHHLHGDAQLNLRIKPDGNGVYVEGLMRYRIASVDDLFDVLERGDQYRSVAATNSNEFSSRSHAVLMLSIMIPEESTDPITGAVTIDDRVMREGQLMLVDLAGSERAHASEGRNYLRLEEAKAINLSLSALGNVMNALAENKPHVPYRDSKLTRLLQNCLGGTARTAIIVNVVPGEDATGETLNALRFANRASKVKVVAKISKHRNFEMLYKEALQKIKELEHFKEHALQLSGMEEEMQEKDNMIEKLNLEVQMQKVQINHLQRENEQLKAAAKLQAEASQNTTSGAKILSRTSSSTSLNAGTLPPTAPSESGLPPVISPATLALLGHSPGIAAAMNMGKTLASSGVSDTDSIATEEIVTLSSANVTSVTQPQKAEDVVAVEAMSKSMKQKATDLKYKRLTQQVMDAERDLREERERHLRTVQELRAIHDQNISHESYFNKRIDELLQELTERQNLLDEHQQVLQSEREDKAQLEQELASTKAKMVNMVDKEQVEIMETLFQETIERMNQRVQNLELQGHQQQQIYLQEQQLHLQEKHQWLEAQQQQQQQSRGGKYNAGTKPSVGIAAKTGTTAAANGTGATAKKTSSTYAFWTPEGANALRQQQLKDQSSKDTGGAVKESPRAPTHVRNLSNSSGISQASDSSQELLQGRSAVTNTRLEPGGRLRPNSSNSNHLQNSNVGTGSPVAATGGIVQASSSSSNLRASSSAPKTLHSVLSPTASTTTAEGSNTSSGVNGVSAGASATTTSPRSSSVTRRSRVVVDPVTGITTTTTTTTTTTNNGSNGGPSNSVPLTSSFRMATPSTPIIGGTEREPLARKMSLTSLHQAAVASSVTSTPPRAASNAPQFESY